MPDHEFWQPDPTGRHKKRWRRTDGTWGDKVADGGRTSIDHYDGPQPGTDAPAPTAEQVTGDAPSPVTAQMLTTGRDPLGFWQTTLAVAFGVLIAAAVGLVALSALAEQALNDSPW